MSRIWAFLISLIIILAFIGGWIANIVKVFGLFAGGVTAELIIRLVGIPIPVIGAVAGYL